MGYTTPDAVILQIPIQTFGGGQMFAYLEEGGRGLKVLTKSRQEFHGIFRRLHCTKLLNMGKATVAITL